MNSKTTKIAPQYHHKYFNIGDTVYLMRPNMVPFLDAGYQQTIHAMEARNIPTYSALLIVEISIIRDQGCVKVCSKASARASEYFFWLPAKYLWYDKEVITNGVSVNGGGGGGTGLSHSGGGGGGWISLGYPDAASWQEAQHKAILDTIHKDLVNIPQDDVDAAKRKLREHPMLPSECISPPNINQISDINFGDEVALISIPDSIVRGLSFDRARAVERLSNVSKPYIVNNIGRIGDEYIISIKGCDSKFHIGLFEKAVGVNKSWFNGWKPLDTPIYNFSLPHTKTGSHPCDIHPTSSPLVIKLCGKSKKTFSPKII